MTSFTVTLVNPQGGEEQRAEVHRLEAQVRNLEEQVRNLLSRLGESVSMNEEYFNPLPVVYQVPGTAKVWKHFKDNEWALHTSAHRDSTLSQTFYPTPPDGFRAAWISESDVSPGRWILKPLNHRTYQ